MAGRTEEVHDLTKIDPWFLGQFADIVALKKTAERAGFRDMSADLLRSLKRSGFGDLELSGVLGVDEAALRARRLELGIEAAYKRIDTCAAEFESFTPYLYGTFEPSARPQPDADDRRS